MRKNRATVRKDGEWFNLREWLGCCDCGLIHRIEFRVGPRKTLQMRAFRSDRLTRKYRKTGRFPLTTE